ncbi:MAG: DNA polymerase I [Bryobacterales bacterium]|nr:DNA polymerase I [Bryobacterales bacterium]
MDRLVLQPCLSGVSWWSMPAKRLFLIDTFGFVFRAYHARARTGAPTMRTRAGLATEAVYIFHNMVRRLLSVHNPDLVAAVFESEGPTFREQEFEDYKANRAETPPDLLEQIPWVRRLLEAMRIPVVECPGFEADDVIGAIARRAAESGLEVVIVSSDKDMLQLVGGRVSMLNPMKDDAWYDRAKVKEFMGVEPEQVADLLALKGDAVDNIPGAPGIGDKGARELVARFGSVEAALERAAEVERKAYRESLENNRDRILMSKRLATIDTSVPVDWEPGERQPPDTAALRDIYAQLEFTSLLKDLGGAEAAPEGLFDPIDRPLLPVLRRMEETGVRIDVAVLAGLSRRMQADIERLSGEIYLLAGRQFNINSPQQLGKVLFEELGLPAPAKTGKTKAYSTAADVLEGLAAQHPIAAKVVEYRQLAKLKGTYVDALPALVNPATGRVHTSFNAAGAATGRLSSSNPNLQNIPIRTELGREIRAAFVPREGWQFVVADYSQIELRLLAHMSQDPLLLEAFRNGEDIHTRTAAEVFGVPPLLVTPGQRRNAKAVNFGIIYGLSAFGLASQLGIPQGEAQEYIRSYFERYAGVKRFIDRQIAEVRRTGETRTLFGRRRAIPDINSKNPSARGFAERTAVNTPLQGTAADLIKLAMVRIDGELQSGRWQAAMLLQVHDELVFEAPPEEVPGLARMARQEMENVHKLDVPLVVDVGSGPNWRDAK